MNKNKSKYGKQAIDVASQLADMTKDGYVKGKINNYNYGNGLYSRFINPKGWDFSNFNPFVYGNSLHTNKISEDLTSGWSGSGATITANADTSPNGEKTASKLTFTANTQYINIDSTKLSKPDGTAFVGTSLLGRTFTFSAWVWSPNKTQICLRISGKATGSDQGTNIVNLTTTPKRVSVTRTFTSTDTDFSLAFENRSSLGFGDGGSGDVYVWGVRVDESDTPKKYYSPCNGFLGFVGDSLTQGSGVTGSNAYPSKVMSRYNGFFHVQDTYNFGVAGRTTRDVINDWSTVNASTTLTNKFLVVWMGTNDLKNGNDVSLTHESLASYCRNARVNGWKVFVLTTIARGDVSIYAQRLEYNNMIKNNYHLYADALIDVASDPRFSTPPTAANDIYNADLAHLTITGYQAIADMVANVLDDGVVFYY